MGNELIAVNDMQTMARAVVQSKLFPDADTEAKALTLMLICQSEHLHPMQALRRYHIIQGRPAMKADAILSDFQKQGGKMQWLKYEDTVCEAEFSHPNGGKLTVKWDMERAKNAGLAGRDNWKKYPRQMLKARVISEGVRAVFPEACQGMYTPEEVQDFDLPKPSALPAPEKSQPQAPQPEQPKALAKSAPNEQGGETQELVKVFDVSEKNGTNPKTKKPWTRYGIQVESAIDGAMTLGTFDKNIAEAVRAVVGRMATISYTNDGKYKTITGIADAPESEVAK